MSEIYPADLDKMMGLPPRSKQTISDGKKNKFKQPVVRKKRKGTKGLLKPK